MYGICLNQSGYIVHTACIECVFILTYFNPLLSVYYSVSSRGVLKFFICHYHNAHLAQLGTKYILTQQHHSEGNIVLFLHDIYLTTLVILLLLLQVTFQILFNNTTCNIINEITYTLIHKLPT